MLITAIISALCGIACMLLGEITSIAFFVSASKFFGAIVVIAILIGLIRLVLEFFDIL